MHSVANGRKMACFLYEYLFSFQRQFHENLLKFLVDVVNTKLLKTVCLKNTQTHKPRVKSQKNVEHENISMNNHGETFR